MFLQIWLEPTWTCHTKNENGTLLSMRGAAHPPKKGNRAPLKGGKDKGKAPEVERPEHENESDDDSFSSRSHFSSLMMTSISEQKFVLDLTRICLGFHRPPLLLLIHRQH